jgi:ribosome-associated protein
MANKSLAAVVIDALEDIKGRDIKVVNVANITSEFDRIAIASGDSTRQTKALANNVVEKVKEAGFHVIGSEGEGTGEWVLVDCGDIVVHIMQPAVREYYKLEELWQEGKLEYPKPVSAPAAKEPAEEKPKKKVAAKKPATKKAAAKKPAAKTPTAKEPTAKKPTAKKPAAKKPAAKKPVAKKPTAKKPAAKKPAAKKPVAKKPVAKKPAAKKPAAKKPAAKKPVTKKATTTVKKKTTAA